MKGPKSAQAKLQGFIVGTALDSTHGWDLGNGAHRDRAESIVKVEDPYFIFGTGPRRTFSTEEATSHAEWLQELYQQRMGKVRYFLHGKSHDYEEVAEGMPVERVHKCVTNSSAMAEEIGRKSDGLRADPRPVGAAEVATIMRGIRNQMESDNILSIDAVGAVCEVVDCE